MKKKKKQQEAQEGLPVFSVEEPQDLPSFSVEGESEKELPAFTVEEPDNEATFTIEDEAPPPEAVPMAHPVIEKPKGEEFKCPSCGKIFIVALSKRPLHIRCPYCKLEGMVE
ncbi:MAG: hypothetical protein JSW28_09105 [Thermoplasmata archaeon]|nr:MAG: hypothetical protein JSW28_09105 [Thermoplasmata archaeon]